MIYMECIPNQTLTIPCHIWNAYQSNTDTAADSFYHTHTSVTQLVSSIPNPYYTITYIECIPYQTLTLPYHTVECIPTVSFVSYPYFGHTQDCSWNHSELKVHHNELKSATKVQIELN